MLDQHWLGFSTDINDLPDQDLDRATIGVGVGLRSATPASIKQQASRLHTRSRWGGRLADDPGEHLDA